MRARVILTLAVAAAVAGLAGVAFGGGDARATAADMIAMAISEIGAIAQRRVALMVDPVPVV